MSQPPRQCQPQQQTQSTLHVAVEAVDVETVARLLESGVSVTACNASGNTALQIAVQGCSEEARESPARLQIMQLMLEHGANPNTLDDLGQSPLHTTTAYSRVDAMQLLLKHGADITVQDSLGRTPVSQAVRLGHKQALQLLCDHAATSETTLQVLQSAIQLAVEQRQWQCCGVLLKAGGQRGGLEWVSKQVAGLAAADIASVGAAVVEGWEQETAGLSEQQECLRVHQHGVAASKVALQQLLLAASAACKQKQLQKQQTQQQQLPGCNGCLQQAM